jgi:hypothetical protein
VFGGFLGSLYGGGQSMFATRPRVLSVVAGLFALYGGLLASRRLDEDDVFFHLSLGRAVLRAGARTVPEPTAFSDFSDPAVASEWLWSLTSYGLFRAAGYAGLCLFGVGLAALVAYGVLRLCCTYFEAPRRTADAAVGGAGGASVRAAEQTPACGADSVAGSVGHAAAGGTDVAAVGGGAAVSVTDKVARGGERIAGGAVNGAAVGAAVGGAVNAAAGGAGGAAVGGDMAASVVAAGRTGEDAPVRRLAAEPAPEASAAISGGRLVWPCALAALVISAVQARIAVRPQLALLAGLPFFLLATRAYARAAPGRRWQLGLGLGLATLVWAQVHGSFVLAPVIFALQVARWPAHARRSQLRTDAVILALLLAALASSAYGSGVARFIFAHAAGDAPRFVREMSRPTWAMLDPSANPSVAAYWLIALAALSGSLLEPRLSRELALAGLGLALLATANRFIAEAALLAAPAAARGLYLLGQHLERNAPLRWRVGVGLIAAALLGWTGDFVLAQRGPIPHLGLATQAFPMFAARVLRRLPAGAPVLTDYAASAAVGFMGAGRLRTFVDGRTPLYFDDTDFAVEREMMRDPQAFETGLARFAVRAAVVRRDSRACQQLAEHWQVALVEPLYTTFLADGAIRPLSELRPCGTRYIAPASCRDPRLEPEIAFVRGQGAGEFADYLGVERAVRCALPLAAAEATLARLAPDARPYRLSFQRTQVELALLQGRFQTATAIWLRMLPDDLGSVGLLQSPGAGALPLRDAQKILERYLDVARDDADLAARTALAEICLRQGDFECVRFEATRAAVRGRPSHALSWLAEHHPQDRVRRDAQRWLEVLRLQRAAADAP